MNRPRERAIVNGIMQRHGVSRETFPHYAMLLDALLTEGVDEIIRNRMEDAESAVPPSVAALKRAGWWPDRAIWADTERRMQANGISPKRLEAGARAWMLKGYRKGNVADLVDFIVNGGADAVSTEARPAREARYLPDDPAQS